MMAETEWGTNAGRVGKCKTECKYRDSKCNQIAQREFAVSRATSGVKVSTGPWRRISTSPSFQRRAVTLELASKSARCESRIVTTDIPGHGDGVQLPICSSKLSLQLGPAGSCTTQNGAPSAKPYTRKRTRSSWGVSSRLTYTASASPKEGATGMKLSLAAASSMLATD